MTSLKVILLHYYERQKEDCSLLTILPRFGSKKRLQTLVKRTRSHLKIKLNAVDMKMSKPMGKISCNDVNHIQG